MFFSMNKCFQVSFFSELKMLGFFYEEIVGCDIPSVMFYVLGFFCIIHSLLLFRVAES